MSRVVDLSDKIGGHYLFKRLLSSGDEKQQSVSIGRYIEEVTQVPGPSV